MKSKNLSRLALLLLCQTPLAVLATEGEEAEPDLSPGVQRVDHDPEAFRPDPTYEDKPYDPEAQQEIYGGKKLIKTARPLIELGRRLYDRGIYEPSGLWLGEKNPTALHFMVYGDWRLAAATVDSDAGERTSIATRLNLDIDLKLTATERFHFLIRPFDNGKTFLGYNLDGGNEDFQEQFDLDLDTAFFEGELGPILMGLTGRENKIDLNFAFGLVPLFTQNGVWLNDAFSGLAFTLPAKSSRALHISNLDLTFFYGFDRLTTKAVLDPRANVYGIAGFVEATQGYWEFGAAQVDSANSRESYTNLSVAFTRRYGGFLSNSVRLITNFGQDLAPGSELADGTLLLIENSLITNKPSTLVPYLNLFVGWDRPQPLALTEGGVLKNTGISFEADAITGFPNLDDTGQDAWGGALGVEYLFNLNRQIVVEIAAFDRMDDPLNLGSEFALGVRFQEPLNNAWIFRVDAMHGWREGFDPKNPTVPREDIFGLRIEIRRKF